MLIFHIFTTLFPILSIVTIGYLYAHYQPIDMTLPNRLNTEIFIPAFIFNVLSDKFFNIVDYQSLIIAGILIMLGSGLITLLLTKLIKIQPKTFVPPMMFTNTGNMGIPVAVFGFGESALQGAVALFIISNVLQFSLGIYIMNRQLKWQHILKSNMMLATIIGLTISVTQVTVPTILLTPIRMLGECAIPLMLFALGVRLMQVDLTHWRIGLLGALICPLSGVIVFLLVSPWLHLTPLHQALLLVFAALPPAVINYIIAEQYQQEPLKVASIVMLGNLMSFISLPIALTFALPLARVS